MLTGKHDTRGLWSSKAIFGFGRKVALNTHISRQLIDIRNENVKGSVLHLNVLDNLSL